MGKSAFWKIRWLSPRWSLLRLNLGLQARLALAFGAVVVLALAANILAERRVAVIERQLILPPSPAILVPAPVPAVPSVQRVVEAPPPPVEVPDTRAEAQSADLLAALEAQARAVDGRRSSGDPVLANQYAAATDALSDSTGPAIGIETVTSQVWRTSRDRPLPSDPTTSTNGSAARSK